MPKELEYSQHYYQTQMDTYALLLAKSGYQTTNLAFVVYYSPKPGELHEGIPFDTEVHELTTYPEKAFDLFRQAKICLEGPLPDAAGQCEFCKWGREAFGV